jgi:hypothetical protein
MSRLDETDDIGETDDIDPIDDAIRRLRGAGFTVDIVPLAGRGVAGGWLVMGRKGEARLLARGPTPLEAWGNALAEARYLGMLGG